MRNNPNPIILSKYTEKQFVRVFFQGATHEETGTGTGTGTGEAHEECQAGHAILHYITG